MGSLEGGLSENILEVAWAKEERCLSIKNLLPVLPVGQVLMERRIEMSRQYQGGGLRILCRLVMPRRDNEEEPSNAFALMCRRGSLILKLQSFLAVYMRHLKPWYQSTIHLHTSLTERGNVEDPRGNPYVVQ